MSEKRTNLQILLEERARVAPTVPESLVRDILTIEQRVQFDDDRREAVRRIGDAVQASLGRQETEGAPDGDAS